MEKRIQHIMDYYHLKSAQAAEMIQREDKGRKDYLAQNFSKNIDDPALYSVVIDTDARPYQETAQMIADAVYPKLKN